MPTFSKQSRRMKSAIENRRNKNAKEVTASSKDNEDVILSETSEQDDDYDERPRTSRSTNHPTAKTSKKATVKRATRKGPSKK